MAKAKKTDPREEITSQICDLLEQGKLPWRMPWSTGRANTPLRDNGDPFTGMNTLLLWIAGTVRGFSNDHWLTFNQAKKHGGAVIKGAKAETVILYKPNVKEVENDEGEIEERTRVYLKAYKVFNVEQIEGLPESFYPGPPDTFDFQPNAAAWDAADRSGARIQRGGDRAYYSPGQDFIQLPERERFFNADAEASTLLHELGHWTGAKHRLDRDLKNRFGDEAYAFEELIAEITAAFTGAELGVEPGHIEDHAAYIQSWLKVLKNDKSAILTAASQAQRAADFILNAEAQKAVA